MVISMSTTDHCCSETYTYDHSHPIMVSVERAHVLHSHASQPLPLLKQGSVVE